MEFLRKNERFVLFCDERRDRTSLCFAEHETLRESGLSSSGSTVVFRLSGQDVYFVLDQQGNLPLSSALVHPSRTVVRLELCASLRSLAPSVAARLGVAQTLHEHVFCALADRGPRPLRMALSLQAQNVGSVLLLQPVSLLVKTTTLEAITGVVRSGWLVKKSIKHDKVEYLDQEKETKTKTKKKKRR